MALLGKHFDIPTNGCGSERCNSTFARKDGRAHQQSGVRLRLVCSVLSRLNTEVAVCTQWSDFVFVMGTERCS